jgi:hypothetical protein
MKLLYQCSDIRNTMHKALKRIAKLTAFASAVALGVAPLFAQNSENEPAAKPSEEAKAPATETSKGEAPTVVVDPRADRLLRAMGDYLKAAKGFRFHAEITFDDVQATGQKIQFGATNDISVRRPDRIYANYEGDTARRRFWYDGLTVTLYDGDHNVYATEKVPPSIDAALDYVSEHLRFNPPLSDFLYGDPGAVLRQDAISGSDLGETDVDGVSCQHLAFVEKNIDWQIWIETGKASVPRKFVITYKTCPGAPQFVAVLSAWDFTTPLSDSLFSADLPPDAELITFLKAVEPKTKE